jgi:hypothetical protein
MTEDIVINTDSTNTTLDIDVSTITITGETWTDTWSGYDINLDDINLTTGETQTISSITERLDTIESRLNILKPDPEMLEKYKILQDLYEQYKTAEALLK